MAAPPVEAGATQETVALVLPEVPTRLAGAPGTVRGTTAALDSEGRDKPTTFEA